MIYYIGIWLSAVNFWEILKKNLNDTKFVEKIIMEQIKPKMSKKSKQYQIRQNSLKKTVMDQTKPNYNKNVEQIEMVIN
jgi:hypothetical protein